MKKIISLLSVLIATCLLFSCPPPGGNPGAPPATDSKETWTVLVHFAIDNNIDYEFEKTSGIITDYLATLESVEAADTHDRINIVLLMDCYNVDSQNNGYVTTFADGYYLLTGIEFSNETALYTPPDGEIHSGSLAESEAFLNWAIGNYPAEGYLYSVFNHGAGFDDSNIDGTYGSTQVSRGIAFDESDDDCLSHHELGQATAFLKSRIGGKIDLFYAFACLMGGVELAYELRDNASLLLFSEEVFPADFWSYEALHAIVDTADPVSADQIGRAFCDSAYDYFSDPGTYRPFTLSLIRLDKIASLAAGLEDYANAAIADINGNANADVYNNDALASLSMLGMLGMNDYYYMDLGDYLERVRADGSISASVKSAAAVAQSRLDDCVVHQTNFGYPDATGITIFHNIWYASSKYPVSLYEIILSFGANAWSDYIALIDQSEPAIDADIYEPDGNAADAKAITVGGAAQAHTFHVSNDSDWLVVSLTEGKTYKIETYGDSIVTDTVIHLYDSAQQMLNFDNNGGIRPYSRLYFQCTAGGVYYIQVFETNGRRGNYLIDIQESAMPQGDAFEPDNAPPFAKPIVIGDPPQTHTLHVGGDMDFMSVILAEGVTYKIETYFNSVSTDTVIGLFNAAGSLIAYDLDSGTDLYSLLIYTCTETNTYYIAVMETSGGTGDYLVDIQTSGLHPTFKRDAIQAADTADAVNPFKK